MIKKLCLLLPLLAAAAAAQTTLTVRLYSLHREHRLNFTARTGDLKYRSCPQCPVTTTKSLSVSLDAGRLQIEDGPAVSHILITGDYRIQPELVAEMTRLSRE